MWQLRHLVIFLSLNFILLTNAGDSIDAATAASTKVTTFGDFPSCREKDANINDCLLKLFAEMLPRAKNGIPELNVPPVDPLAINRTTYIFSHPLVQGKVMAKNIKIHGLSETVAKSLDYKRQGDEVRHTVKSHIPKLFVEGLYKAKIQVNNVNISSKGTFNVTLENIDVDFKTVSDLVKRDGHRYMFLKSLTFDPTVGNMIFKAEGLLPEPLLNDAIIEFINQNWRTVYKTLIPETRQAWEPEIVKLNHAYFSRIPVDEFIRDE